MKQKTIQQLLAGPSFDMFNPYDVLELLAACARDKAALSSVEALATYGVDQELLTEELSLELEALLEEPAPPPYAARATTLDWLLYLEQVGLAREPLRLLRKAGKENFGLLSLLQQAHEKYTSQLEERSDRWLYLKDSQLAAKEASGPGKEAAGRLPWTLIRSAPLPTQEDLNRTGEEDQEATERILAAWRLAELTPQAEELLLRTIQSHPQGGLARRYKETNQISWEQVRLVRLPHHESPNFLTKEEFQTRAVPPSCLPALEWSLPHHGPGARASLYPAEEGALLFLPHGEGYTTPWGGDLVWEDPLWGRVQMKLEAVEPTFLFRLEKGVETTERIRLRGLNERGERVLVHLARLPRQEEMLEAARYAREALYNQFPIQEEREELLVAALQLRLELERTSQQNESIPLLAELAATDTTCQREGFSEIMRSRSELGDVLALGELLDEYSDLVPDLETWWGQPWATVRQEEEWELVASALSELEPPPAWDEVPKIDDELNEALSDLLPQAAPRPEKAPSPASSWQERLRSLWSDLTEPLRQVARADISFGNLEPQLGYGAHQSYRILNWKACPEEEGWSADLPISLPADRNSTVKLRVSDPPANAKGVLLFGVYRDLSHPGKKVRFAAFALGELEEGRQDAPIDLALVDQEEKLHLALLTEDIRPQEEEK